MGVLAISGGDLPCSETLAAALAALPEAAPVVILIHGFRYAPGVAGHDPHDLILSPAPTTPGGRIFSWPRHLRLTGQDRLAIAFGWTARGDIWSAYRRAGTAGGRLAALIGRVHALDPNRPVHVVAHSLGARVALTALPRCPPGSVRRMILIAGAAFGAEARVAMASDAARGLEVVHVRGPENAVFEAILRLALPWAGPSLGAGVSGVPGWVDLSLGAPATLAALSRLGHRIRPARYRICHWSGYARPGVFGLYRSILAGGVTLADLARAAAAAPAADRRSGPEGAQDGRILPGLVDAGMGGHAV